MKKTILLTILLLLVAACSRPATNTQQSQTPTTAAPQVTSPGVVKVSIDPVELKSGSVVDANVRLRIDAGYHVNANPASDPYLRATELKLTAPEGITINFLTYPTGLTRAFPFSDKPLAVYEGEAVIKVQLASAKGTQAGSHDVSGKLNVQACDDHVCYAPGTIDVTIPVTIK